MEANESSSERGNAWGQEVEAKGKNKHLLETAMNMKTLCRTPYQQMVGDSAKGMGMGMSPNAKQFFGGNFWPQIESEKVPGLTEFLPKVDSMSDDAVLVEVAQLSNMNKEQMLAELEENGRDSD